ncbi:MAG TPA: NifB/NifX family molybdenum-iron cluster-binding protein [Candidatus Hydrogenedentes bacterium]|nr:NifB/NifX family molybdenum-iron cluster-binding protein [Candidatus Hydrogenedentota bacterium]HIJ72489.1 NifB/NifX family molybdenum-iron cluster-binding protein [Candidatus Hydrogenedentota bacterium]
MKVAVTSQGQTMASEVDPRFGRARFFIVLDTESGVFAVHDNAQNLNAAQGAGIQAAQNVAQLGVEAIVTGNIGPKAHSALEAGHVKVYIGAEGTIRRAIERFNAGQLECADRPNVGGHWR